MRRHQTSSRLAAVSLEPVAVGIEDEGGIIVLAIVLSEARQAVVASAGSDGSGMKGIDAGAGRRLETEVEPGAVVGGDRAVAGANPQGDRIGAVAQRRRRLAEAPVAKRLASSRAPITAIALDVGFEDLSNFIRSFRAEFGLSPRQYRAVA